MALAMEHYKQIRQAQINGARTIEELKSQVDFEINGNNIKDVNTVLINACKCMGLSIQEVVHLAHNGVETLDQLQMTTNAGMVCGRCNALLQNILDNKR